MRRDYEKECAKKRIDVDKHPWKCVASRDGSVGGYQRLPVGQDVDDFMKAEWLSIVASVIRQNEA